MPRKNLLVKGCLKVAPGLSCAAPHCTVQCSSRTAQLVAGYDVSGVCDIPAAAAVGFIVALDNQLRLSAPRTTFCCLLMLSPWGAGGGVHSICQLVHHYRTAPTRQAVLHSWLHGPRQKHSKHTQLFLSNFTAVGYGGYYWFNLVQLDGAM